MNHTILKSFVDCRRYHSSPTYLKPFIDPQRFIRNQIRSRFPNQVGTVNQVAAFHLNSFSVVAGEVVSEGIASHGFIEPDLTEAFLRLIKPGQTAVDIGMHLGYFSTLFAMLVGKAGAVHSFEPTPSTRNLASANIGRFANIRVHPNAVWSHRESMTFHDYGTKYMAFNSVTDARLDDNLAPVQKIEVEAVSLDDFRKSLTNPIHIIKIDAETAEQQIIMGGSDTFKNDRPIVTIEVGDESSTPGHSRHLIRMMSDLGYESWEFKRNNFSIHQIRDYYTYDNLIFAPSGTSLNEYTA